MDLKEKVDKIIEEFEYDVNLDDYPVTESGMVKVDAYLIDTETVEDYVKDRELLAAVCEAVFRENCHEVRRDWQESQDGEAVLGLDESDELIRVMHLDPYSIEDLKNAILKNDDIVELILENS